MRRQTSCWTLKPTSYATQLVMSTPKPVKIHVPAIINEVCIPRPVTLKVPKLRQHKFETAIIERYRRREASVEEALIEMYLAGVSVRRVEDITQALWGTRVSPGTVSNLNKKIYKRIDQWRNRPLEVKCPYVYLNGIVLKRTWAEQVRNVSILDATLYNKPCRSSKTQITR